MYNVPDWLRKIKYLCNKSIEYNQPQTRDEVVVDIEKFIFKVLGRPYYA